MRVTPAGPLRGLQAVDAQGRRPADRRTQRLAGRQGEKGRDRERYPIVYGARLKVKDGQKVDQGQTLVEWDPYTFSILTEEPGSIRFKDIIEGVTVHEEVDEVTGLSRLIIVDSPDEKKQPTIEIRDKAGKVVRKYHMPSRSHDGGTASGGSVRRAPKTSARDGPSRPNTSFFSAARGRALRGTQAARPGRHL